VNRSDTPAIRCSGVWQVFGENAKQELATALAQSGNDSEKAALQLRNKGLVPAVQDAAFSIDEGELFVIMGLSGSGKSTLIRCIARLIDATAGTIEIEGDNILKANMRRLTALRRDTLGMVFQHFGLFPHMSVLENVAFPLKMKGIGKKQRIDRAQEVVELVGLGGLEASYPRELSGGQRQRVGIARSLAVNPDIWFLDEPFSALDPLIRRQLQDEFLNIQKTLKKSIVFITHDIAEALKIADRIAIMRDGKIVQIGTPTDIVLHPVNDYVREFTVDVAKGRHAKVGSMMQASVNSTAIGAGNGVSAGTNDPKLRIGMTLDAALERCMSLYEPVPVWDDNENIVGTVNPRDLAAALNVETSSNPQEQSQSAKHLDAGSDQSGVDQSVVDQ